MTWSYTIPPFRNLTYLHRTQTKNAPWELFLEPELFVVTSWIEALTFCWMSVLVFTSCSFFFFYWAYTETLITSNCKKKARLEIFLKPELFVVTSWKEALTSCWMIFSCFYFLLVFFFCCCLFMLKLCSCRSPSKSTALFFLWPELLVVI